MNARNYFNADLDLRVTFRGEDFAILGDDSKLSDEDLLALYEGRPVDGWTLVTL